MSGGLIWTNQRANRQISHHLLQIQATFELLPSMRSQRFLPPCCLQPDLLVLHCTRIGHAPAESLGRQRPHGLWIEWTALLALQMHALPPVSQSVSGSLLPCSVPLFHSIHVHLSLLPLHLATFESLHSTPANKVRRATPSWVVAWFSTPWYVQHLKILIRWDSMTLKITGWWFQPLWKIWKSIGMMTFPIDLEK